MDKKFKKIKEKNEEKSFLNQKKLQLHQNSLFSSLTYQNSPNFLSSQQSPNQTSMRNSNYDKVVYDISQNYQGDSPLYKELNSKYNNSEHNNGKNTSVFQNNLDQNNNTYYNQNQSMQNSQSDFQNTARSHYSTSLHFSQANIPNNGSLEIQQKNFQQIDTPMDRNIRLRKKKNLTVHYDFHQDNIKSISQTRISQQQTSKDEKNVKMQQIQNDLNNQINRINRVQLVKKQKQDNGLQSIQYPIPGRYNVKYELIDKKIKGLPFEAYAEKKLFPEKYKKQKIILEDEGKQKEIDEKKKIMKKLANLEYDDEQNHHKKINLKGNAFKLDFLQLEELEKQKKSKKKQLKQEKVINQDNFQRIYNSIQFQVKNDVENQIKKNMPPPGSPKAQNQGANFIGADIVVPGAKNEEFSAKPVDDFVDEFEKQYIDKFQEAKHHLNNIKFMTSVQ